MKGSFTYIKYIKMYPNPFIMIYQLIMQTYAIRLKTQNIVVFF